LAQALDGLLSLDCPDGGFEIVVVDDGSPPADGIVPILEKAAANSPVPFHWESFPANRGAAAARNRAWRHGRGEWIALTDDDCVPRHDWLVRLLDHAGSADVVQGRTCPDPAQEHLLARPFSRSLRVDGLNGFYQTFNIAYRRTVLEQLGGFDESFRLACDDTDLGWRARSAGARAVFAGDAVVEHEVADRTWMADMRSRRRWAETVKLVARHPEVRTLAWQPFVYRRGHAPVIGVVLSLPVLASRRGRRVWVGTMAAVMARELLKAGSAEEALTASKRRLIDLYETSVLLRASVRERTLFL